MNTFKVQGLGCIPQLIKSRKLVTLCSFEAQREKEKSHNIPRKSLTIRPPLPRTQSWFRAQKDKG